MTEEGRRSVSSKEGGREGEGGGVIEETARRAEEQKNKANDFFKGKDTELEWHTVLYIGCVCISMEQMPMDEASFHVGWRVWECCFLWTRVYTVVLWCTSAMLEATVSLSPS